MKRLFDIVVALITLVLIAPVLFTVAVYIAIETGRPIFYRQQRVGLGGKPFTIIKFRSMVQNADRIGGYSTRLGDPRITRSGRVLRKTSLDELPQLWNVLVGEMSIVGPRADVPQQKENYSDGEWSKRCSVKPGITGLAQSTLRSAATIEQRRDLDLRYVDQASPWLDLRIIGRTFLQILLRGGGV